jgi:DNA-binding MarR family transcriptional regulator
MKIVLSTQGVYVPHERLGDMLKRAQHAMGQNMDRKLKDLELSAHQYSVLTSIEGEPGASIARLAFVTPQTMRAMFLKLEQAGLIARAPDAEHGRILRTALTHQGREILALARVAASTSEQIAREAASDDAVDILRRIAEVHG